MSTYVLNRKRKSAGGTDDDDDGSVDESSSFLGLNHSLSSSSPDLDEHEEEHTFSPPVHENSDVLISSPQPSNSVSSSISSPPDLASSTSVSASFANSMASDISSSPNLSTAASRLPTPQKKPRSVLRPTSASSTSASSSANNVNTTAVASASSSSFSLNKKKTIWVWEVSHILFLCRRMVAHQTMRGKVFDKLAIEFNNKYKLQGEDKRTATQISKLIKDIQLETSKQLAKQIAKRNKSPPTGGYSLEVDVREQLDVLFKRIQSRNKYLKERYVYELVKYCREKSTVRELDDDAETTLKDVEACLLYTIDFNGEPTIDNEPFSIFYGFSAKEYEKSSAAKVDNEKNEDEENQGEETYIEQEASELSQVYDQYGDYNSIRNTSIARSGANNVHVDDEVSLDLDVTRATTSSSSVAPLQSLANSAAEDKKKKLTGASEKRQMTKDLLGRLSNSIVDNEKVEDKVQKRHDETIGVQKDMLKLFEATMEKHMLMMDKFLDKVLQK